MSESNSSATVRPGAHQHPAPEPHHPGPEPHHDESDELDEHGEPKGYKESLVTEGHLVEAAKFLCEQIEKHGWKAAIIGGFAIALHGIHRTTKDVDCLVSEQIGPLKEMLKEHKEFLVPSMVTAEEITFWYTAHDKVIVKMQALQSPEFGPKPADNNVVTLSHLPVLSLEELFITKILSYSARDEPRDLTDIRDILRDKGAELKEVDLAKYTAQVQKVCHSDKEVEKLMAQHHLVPETKGLRNPHAE